jgi:hypothetical protein
MIENHLNEPDRAIEEISRFLTEVKATLSSS